MTFELKISEEFDKYKIDEYFDEEISRKHYIFRFDNDYGASVVKSPHSYGYKHDLWELAVIDFIDDYDNENRYDVIYPEEMEIDDVLGWLGDEEVEETLRRIMKLTR